MNLDPANPPPTRGRIIQMLRNFANGTYQAIDREIVGLAAKYLVESLPATEQREYRAADILNEAFSGTGDGKPLQSAAHPGATTELPEGALIRDYIKLPALEIDWRMTGDRLEARVADIGQDVQFGLYVAYDAGMDLEWAIQHLRAALEAAWHTYRRNTDK